MTSNAAEEFDNRIRELITPYADGELLNLVTIASIIWGRPTLDYLQGTMKTHGFSRSNFKNVSHFKWSNFIKPFTLYMMCGFLQ